MKRATTQDAHYKDQFRAVAIAIQADARSYDGGVPALADQLHCNYGSLKNALTPTNTDAELTLHRLLAMIEATGGQRTITAVARLGDMTALPICEAPEGDSGEVGAAFLKVVHRAATIEVRTVEALADGRLTFSEREEVGNLLDDLIAAAVQMRALVRGR